MASNSYLLGGVDFTDIALARVDEREAITTYPALIEEVRTRCGPEVAALFAEPVVGSNRATGARNVAWFGALEGTPFALRQLDGNARQQVGELLRQRLHAFSSLFSDSRSGAVFASWLHVLSEDSILAVAGQPVIKNWGMLAKATAASGEARDAHFRNGLGQYLPTMPTPPFTDLEAQGFGAGMAQLAEREAARAAPPPEPPHPAPPPVASIPVASPPARTTVQRRWLAPAIACALAALCLAILAFGHVLRYPTTLPGADDAAIDAQRQTNQALRDRLDELHRAGGGDVCRAPPGAQPGRTPAPATPLPPAPERTRVITKDPASERQAESTLGTLLDKATVLVIVGDSLGSGFFVSDRHVVTNHHVVGDAQEARVGNKATGGLVHARVLAVGAGAERGTQDIAVLELDQPQPGAATLQIGVAPARMEQVTASGFPGAVLTTIEHDGSSPLPEANFTQGIVTQHQVQAPDGIATIIHTAQIGHGNSGGPLVDAGGCAVGINSWLSPDAVGDTVFSTYFQALDAAELRRFLQARSIAFAAADASCRPVVAQATPPAGSPPAARP